MFTQLTKDHCLYVIHEDLLTLFVHCTEQQLLDGYLSTAASLDPLNNHAIVLQIWCMLNEDKYRLIIHPEKMLPYSIDCYILKLLRTDEKIQLFLRTRTWNQQDKFILAYYLACATLQWGDEIIAAHEKGQSLFEINQSRDYFTLADEGNLAHEEDHDFYYFQKMIVHAMAMDYNTTSNWAMHINEALSNYRRGVSVPKEDEDVRDIVELM